jgi:ankyrin repeat protein
MNAASIGYTQAVEILIAAGADLNLLDYGGLSALIGAVIYGRSHVAELLI